jgi:hypothetical protein
MSIKSTEVRNTSTGPVKVQTESGFLQTPAARAETQKGGKGYAQVSGGNVEKAKKEAIGRAQAQDFDRSKKKK